MYCLKRNLQQLLRPCRTSILLRPCMKMPGHLLPRCLPNGQQCLDDLQKHVEVFSAVVVGAQLTAAVSSALGTLNGSLHLALPLWHWGGLGFFKTAGISLGSCAHFLPLSAFTVHVCCASMSRIGSGEDGRNGASAAAVRQDSAT